MRGINPACRVNRGQHYRRVTLHTIAARAQQVPTQHVVLLGTQQALHVHSCQSSQKRLTGAYKPQLVF